MLFCKERSIPASGSAENESPATEKETGDLDAMTKQARSKIQKICQEIRSVHKEEEARGLYELVEAKVAEGERWFERLNSARTGKVLFLICRTAQVLCNIFCDRR